MLLACSYGCLAGWLVDIVGLFVAWLYVYIAGLLVRLLGIPSGKGKSKGHNALENKGDGKVWPKGWGGADGKGGGKGKGLAAEAFVQIKILFILYVCPQT